MPKKLPTQGQTTSYGCTHDISPLCVAVPLAKRDLNGRQGCQGIVVSQQRLPRVLGPLGREGGRKIMSTDCEMPAARQRDRHLGSVLKCPSPSHYIFRWSWNPAGGTGEHVSGRRRPSPINVGGVSRLVCSVLAFPVDVAGSERDERPGVYVYTICV
ncbi:hypothetical protein F4859DRAFT_480790 [Xylaria cf. heliscus]|nr:hypothetical protein F4859DRAFT_480790 [Xylaria cf. heliscus]